MLRTAANWQSEVHVSASSFPFPSRNPSPELATLAYYTWHTWHILQVAYPNQRTVQGGGSSPAILLGLFIMS